MEVCNLGRVAPGTHILTLCWWVCGVDDGLATHVSKAFEQATALRNLLPEFRPNEIVIEHVHIYICTRKRIAAVFIEAENWKQLLCSSVEELFS